jgi:hypothetical protein
VGAAIVVVAALLVVVGVTVLVVLLADVDGDGAATGVSPMEYTFNRHAFPHVAVDPAHFIEQSESAVLAVEGGEVEEQ